MAPDVKWLRVSCFVALFICSINASLASSISGHVYDADTHGPVADAAVFIVDTQYLTITDSKGGFTFPDLPNGTYAVAARLVGFETSLPVSVTIKDGASSATLDINLKRSQTELVEVTVQGIRDQESNLSARTDERLAPNVINVVSARTIELMPDLSVADVMQRVSGVSMTKDSYGRNSRLIIRGMPPRYNSALVNGVLMPGTSSTGRSLDLDIFGANLIGRVEVIKGVTPDLEADAIGGTVNIKTKESPDSAFLSVQLGSGYGQYYFNHSYLTFDNSTVAKKDPSELHGTDYLAQEKEFPRQNLVAKSSTATPNLIFGIAGGNSFFRKKLGLMAAVSGQAVSDANTYVFTSYAPARVDGKPSPQYVENQAFSSRRQRLGGYIKADYHFNSRHRISLFSSAFMTTDLRVREFADHQTENGGQFVRPITTQTQTDNTSLLANMLRGNHELLRNLSLEWIVMYAIGSSQSPDFADVDLAKGGSDPPTLNYSRPVVRNWQHNEDTYKSGYLNVKYRPVFFNRLFEFKAGGLYRNRFRKNYANEYFFQPYADGSSNDYKFYPNPDLLTVPLRNDQNQQEQKGNAYLNPGNFRAREDIAAAYAMVSTTFGNLNALAGVRYENTYLYTEHNQNNIQIPVAKATQAYQDFFPSIHLTYKLTDRQNLRFSIYKALNRPDFVEVIPYNNPRAGTLRGNPNLRAAYANSVDLRYEIYPSQEDVFSAGLFYKNIKNAIEDILAPDGGTTPRNVATPTTNYGLELVAYKKIRNYIFSANYTFTKSVISDQAINFVYKDSVLIANPVVQYKRTLVGQSPHLFNLSLSYFSSNSGFKSSVTYTLQGENLSATDNSHLHFNRYQADYHNLGLSLEKRFWRKLFLSVKASNLLNSPLTWFMKEENGVLIRKSYSYQVYYASLKYNF